jgi:hypothetical protein
VTGGNPEVTGAFTPLVTVPLVKGVTLVVTASVVTPPILSIDILKTH